MYIHIYIYIYICMVAPPQIYIFDQQSSDKYSESETLMFTTLLAIVFKAWWTNFKTHNEHMHI